LWIGVEEREAEGCVLESADVHLNEFFKEAVPNEMCMNSQSLLLSKEAV
jgi:hypothetical protein